MAHLSELSPNYYMLDPKQQDAQDIAKAMTWYSPRFSPKDVPRFYDISSLTENPPLFKRIIDILCAHYKAMGDGAPTHIVGFDARGFLLGTPIAMMLGIPFVMLRKQEKSPGVLVQSAPYAKEYAEKAPDTMVLRTNAIKPGDRIVLIDDLIATGGTAISGFELVSAIGAKVIEFAAVIAIPFCDGVTKIREYNGGEFKDVNIFKLIHDDLIGDENCADPKDFADGAPRTTPAAISPSRKSGGSFPSSPARGSGGDSA